MSSQSTAPHISNLGTYSLMKLISHHHVLCLPLGHGQTHFLTCRNQLIDITNNVGPSLHCSYSWSAYPNRHRNRHAIQLRSIHIPIINLYQFNYIYHSYKDFLSTWYWTIILSLILYGHETSPLTFSDEAKFWVFENKVLMTMKMMTDYWSCTAGQI